MEIDLAALPDDVEALHHLIGDLVAAREHERAEARAEIERLRHIVKLLQRNRFGRRSERLDSDQMDLPGKSGGTFW
jgi:transposase